jgi:1,4-alpha-glucan branching enzyme
MVKERPDGSVEFEFYRPGVHQVYLAGDFNGWQKNSMTMLKSPDGWWRCRLTLAPGVYQFRYLADSEWYTDYAAFGLERGPFGWNSVLKVEAPQTQPQTQPTAKPSIRPDRMRDLAANREEEDVLSRSSRIRRPARVPAMTS